MGPLQDIFETWARFLYEENATLAFLRRQRWLILAVSVAVLIPCFWHERIEAGDLASHAYNAWLAQLIEKGQAPGLYIARQWDNVQFDVVLLWQAKIVGFAAAQKIAVSACVLTFFWGVFAFVNAVTEQPPWLLAPCIAMLAYGYSFSMGFMNYCWSLGLACFALAMVWRARRVDWIGGAILAVLTFAAHPIGFLWLVGTLAYVKIKARLPGWWNVALPVAAAAISYWIFWYTSHRPALMADWDRGAFYFYNGADQLALYGKRYIGLAVAAFCFGVICVAADFFRGPREQGSWKRFVLPFELYAITFCGTVLLPENLRPSPEAGWIGLLGSRLTTVSAILGICVLALLKPKRWQLAGFGVCAAVFFAFLYQDTGWLNGLEATAEQLVARMPPGTRVVVTIDAPKDSRIQFIDHAVERACVGHCFSYANYEPASAEFRVRVREGSPVVTSSTDTAEDMASGEHEVDESDLPLKQIYQCDASDLTKLCMRDLKAGDDLNIEIGHQPGHR
ncbi:MAG TPA: hypothetical protein VNB49_19120 [Candidatus Dormibacteraeota bacterium]|nr:hypothetical protein [Candidatus Dormibacteraeota bacterium]